MNKNEIALRLEKLKVNFFASPTKGLIFYENLILPAEDNGQSEAGYTNLRKSFSKSNEAQKALVEDIIENLKLLRQEALSNKDSLKIIKDYRDKIIDEVATYRVIAENK